jgi:membrane-associated phospholipid phosphatase
MTVLAGALIGMICAFAWIAVARIIAEEQEREL